MYDSNLVLQALTTSIVGATQAFNGPGLDLLTTPQGEETFHARVEFPGAQIATAAVTGTYTIGESSDNTNFFQCSRTGFVTFAIGTVLNTGPVFLPFVRSQRYVRVSLNLSNATSGLTSTYKVDLGIARP